MFIFALLHAWVRFNLFFDLVASTAICTSHIHLISCLFCISHWPVAEVGAVTNYPAFVVSLPFLFAPPIFISFFFVNPSSSSSSRATHSVHPPTPYPLSQPCDINSDLFYRRASGSQPSVLCLLFRLLSSHYFPFLTPRLAPCFNSLFILSRSHAPS